MNASGLPAPWIQPIYVAVEASGRMNSIEVDCAQRIIQTVIDTVESERVLGSISRLALIAYNDTAALVSPLAKTSDMHVPMLVAEGGANYTKAFQLMRRQIDDDYLALKAEAFRVCRPFVLFVTTGEPTCDRDARDDALTALAALDVGGPPEMAVLGIGAGVTRRCLAGYRIGRASVTSVYAAREFAELTATAIARMLASVGADDASLRPVVDLDIDCGTPFVDTAVSEDDWWRC